jgi:phosphopantothenoylcysteine decarboxylase/phosphopantothenate--cysteine ligase
MSAPLRVLLGVTGGIAAFKSAELVRRLRAQGHEVRCALTRGAAAFVTPLTLEVLSGQPVYQEEYLSAGGGGEEAHIAAAEWAQVACVVPATAHVLARLALGLADDFLTTTLLAFRGPLVLAPAMHTAMWEKAATQEHLDTLRRRGAQVVGPVAGALASGEVGMGRMAEPEEVVLAVEQAAAGNFAAAERTDGMEREDPRPSAGPAADGPLAGRTVLVTAGPTHEPVDPVRFLGNRSSGKMGFALAGEAARRGARVVLVAGPVALPTPPGVERIDVTTAREMEQAAHQQARRADLLVMAAAVADYRPVRVAAEKIKRGSGLAAIELAENPDILAGLRRAAPGAVAVGFAAETRELEQNARAKLAAKGIDFLVANDVSRADIAFGSDANEVTVFRRGQPPLFLPRRPKGELAAVLLDLFTTALHERDERERPAVVPR